MMMINLSTVEKIEMKKRSFSLYTFKTKSKFFLIVTSSQTKFEY